MTTPQTELDRRFSDPDAQPTSWEQTLVEIKRAERAGSPAPTSSSSSPTPGHRSGTDAGTTKSAPMASVRTPRP
jgi:hypothetical protein